jgi:Caspase domain
MDGSRTWALVVGIDVYADATFPRLEGAANDAVAAVKWLRRLRVPDGQILLHVAPCEAARPAVDALGLPYRDATLDSIWESAGTLEKNSGDRLFVFLSGHGFFEPTKGRLFLTANARQRNMTNLGIEPWIQYLLSLPYTWQYLVMDGCQNYPYSPTRRSEIDPVLYPGVAVPPPRDGTSMTAFFAASRGEVVPEVAGRGAYLRWFFELANPAKPYLPAVSLDFETGRKSLSVRLLHDAVARAAAVDAAALRPPVPLNPGMKPYGRAEALADVMLFDFDEEQTSSISVEVLPPIAAADLVGLRLRCVRAPFWERRLPLPPERVVPVPINNRLPKGLEFVVDLDVSDGTPWSSFRADGRFTTDSDFDLKIDLAELAQRMPAPTRGADDAVFVTVDKQGWKALYKIPDGVYADMERRAVGTIAPGGDAVKFQQNESGPDLVLPGGLGGTGSWLLGSIAQEILHQTPSDVAVTTALRRGQPDTTAVRFLFAADPVALTGPLKDLPAVTISPRGVPAEPAWRTRVGHSLADLARHPFLGVAQGAHDIRVDLPWGSWSSTVDVPRDSVVNVALPAAIGFPPLRVALRDRWPYAASVVIAAGEAPAEAALRDQRRDRERPLMPSTDGSPASGQVYDLPQGQSPRGQRLVRLAWHSGPRVSFPARLDGVLGVELRDGAVRVEPLSHVPQPLWDLLVTVGRLDALTAAESHQLSYGKWEDPILGLAAAYALQSTHPELLPTVLGNLRDRLGMSYPDLILLEASHRLGELVDEAARVKVLRALAAEQAVPVLRWGVPLARLLVKAHAEPLLVSWDRMLARIERGLSTLSIWTAWSTPTAGRPGR